MSEKFLDSFSLWNADRRLVDWDEGFEREFPPTAPMLRPGISYAEILWATFDDPASKQFLRETSEIDTTRALIQDRLDSFGVDRIGEYPTPDGKIVRVDEHRTRSGQIHRLAWDVTGEGDAGQALSNANHLLDAADADRSTALTETRRNPDGSYVYQPISERMRQLFDLPAEAVGQDPMIIHARMSTTAEEDAKRLAQMERTARTLENFSDEYGFRDGKDRQRWIRQSMIPRRESDGTVIFSGVVRDITREREMEDALARAEHRLEAVDQDTYGVLTETRRNPDGSYIFPPLSKEVLRLFDLPAELVGGDSMLVYSRFEASPEDNARSNAVMEEGARTLVSFAMEYRVRDGKDRRRWIRQSMIPRREADGTVIFSGVMRDVTREKEAEDQIELLRSVVVQFTDAILIFEVAPQPEVATKIVYVNAKFTELFGGSADELVGQPTRVLISNDLNGTGADLIGIAIRSGDGLPFEYEATGKDGRVFWVEVRVITVQNLDNGGFRRVVISRDISERRHAQDELLRAKDAAEAGNLAKGQFLTNMSHELRTPLNAIIGFTELIERGVARTGWVPSYTEYLADVSASGRHLLDLINTILDLAKIDSGQLGLDIDPVDLCELTRTSLALVSGMARDGNIAISADIPTDHADIPGDYLKLKQVLLNILSNAIKFTPADGKIGVALRFTKTKAVITVTDTGCGIAGCDIERVMLPFVQVGNTFSRKYGGSGLGLSIARELCGLHGGTLRIASVEGQGTTVRISLPVSGPTAMPIRHGVAAESGFRQPGAAANRADVVAMPSRRVSARAA